MLSRFWLQNITCKCIFNINGCISTSALTTYLIYTIANHINYRINNGFLREAIYEYSDVRRCRGHREYLQIGHKEPDPHRTGQELTTKVREETLRLSILNSRWEPVEERTKGERGALSHLGGGHFTKQRDKGWMSPRMSPASRSCVYLFGCYWLLWTPSIPNWMVTVGIVTC